MPRFEVTRLQSSFRQVGSDLKIRVDTTDESVYVENVTRRHEMNVTVEQVLDRAAEIENEMLKRSHATFKPVPFPLIVRAYRELANADLQEALDWFNGLKE